MTFKETDFPALMKFMKSFVNEESNPFLVKDMILQMVRLYESVPLYPGIVNMCVGKVKKGVDPKELVPGQKIFLKNGEDSYVGVVSKKMDDGVKLKQVQAITYEDEYEFEFDEMENVQVVNEKVLEELWPSLVFEKDKKR